MSDALDRLARVSSVTLTPRKRESFADELHRCSSQDEYAGWAARRGWPLLEALEEIEPLRNAAPELIACVRAVEEFHHAVVTKQGNVLARLALEGALDALERKLEAP